LSSDFGVSRHHSFDEMALARYDNTMSSIIEKNIQKGVREVSRQMGIKEKELVDRALLLYLESAKGILDLEREFRAWDMLSDEAYRVSSKRFRPSL
jgi:hypothetical protein